MTVVGMWDVLIGANPSIVYLLAFRDLAHRQASWDAFSIDPQWVAARQRSEAAGPILESTESIILRTVPFVADPIPGPDAREAPAADSAGWEGGSPARSV